MNKRGQLFFGIMMFILIICILVITAPVLKEIIEIGRGTATSGGLDCDNASISTAVKATCVITDISLIYYAVMLLAAAGTAMIGWWAYKSGAIGQ